MEPFVYALILTSFAGLATGVGSALAFFSRRSNVSFLSSSLGFSAGVMIYVSFVEILPQALQTLSSSMDHAGASIVVTSGFFGGMILIGLIDRLVPESENPHEVQLIESIDGYEPAREPIDQKTLFRMGIMSALAIGIHNFPEGLATFLVALNDQTTGLGIAIAIAIHNIPEGIAVSVPIYFATGDRKKAFTLSFLSGLSEPVGALLGYLILLPFMNDFIFAIVFAGVAGIMVFISLDELLPAAEKYGKHHQAIYGIVSGMIVMAISLIMLM